tara:strand:+ start:698 stop:2176 length:1479 start_codon:yes stop_codon:yes gene_type:complete
LKKAFIIGSGVAGLSCAIRLKSEGYDVHVFEKNKDAGGKISELKEQGFRFDMGPSLLTMPHLIEDLFKLCKKNIKSYFKYKKKKIICNYFYEDGTSFSAPSNKIHFAKKASEIFDVTENEITNYFEKSKNKYDLTKSVFLENSLHKYQNYFSRDALKAILNYSSLDINKSLSSLNEKTFKDKRLVQYFNRFSTYNGSSPYKTPGIMSIIPHLEHHYGAFFPEGGMNEISKSLYLLAKDLGVKFNFESIVDKILIKNKKAVGLSVNSKKKYSDNVISNADVNHTYNKLLSDYEHPKKKLKQEKSSSALIFFWGIKKRFNRIDLHNIFFSSDYKKEFDNIFEKKIISDDPTVYINVTCKENPNDAPKGCENWFTMINVPHNDGQDWKNIIINSRKNIIKKLNKNLKTDISKYIVYESVLDPSQIESYTNSDKGALYGSSSNSIFSAFLRHPNFSNKIKNLYFCGGSVHPGGGIPLCLMSGKIVSDLIQKKSVYR